MNPLLASPRLDTVAGQDTELVFLEGLLNDDCKCEGIDHDTGPCTVKVTHRYTCCEVSKNVCSLFATEAIMQRTLYVCAGCGRNAEDCWTIRPI